MSVASELNERNGPWWQHPMVWLVISGPACVVVAAFVTLWLAIRQPDPVISENYYREGLNINQTSAVQDSKDETKKLLPALMGRNHAATPERDVPSSARQPADLRQ